MNKKYDVGILGVWSGCNYGSIATYYALNQVVSSMGKSVLMIDKPIISEDDVELKKTHARRFAMEHYNISRQYPFENLHALNNLCDTFLLGSDQVWNYGISKNFRKAYYFDFAAQEKKKIAYAVSFGHSVDFAPPEERKIISEYMSYFDGISTRESDGVRLCKECYGIKAEQVLDPVFLAPPEIYSRLIEKSKYIEDAPFLATYILDPTDEKREAILHLQKELGGIKVVNLLDGLPWLFEKNKQAINLPNCIENLQIEEWLYYLSRAEFIITDSCHGMSFALIFQKNFIAICNRRRGYSRFQSLSVLFHVGGHVITDPLNVITNPDLLTPVNYSVVNDIMAKEKIRCYKWLYDVLSGPKKDSEELKKRNIIGKPSLINPRAMARPSNWIEQENTVRRTVEKAGCTGCGTCALVCPKNAISMQINQEGFLNPEIDREKCINCGACLVKCAAENPEYKNNEKPECYAMMASDEIRKISSSGGMFTVSAEYVIDQGGFVCGAAYNDDFTVQHIIVRDKEELKKLRGSKYMQSNAGIIYKEIRELLERGELVLFTGMPCQVAGLYSFLGKDYALLWTIDLLCHGITSSRVFEKYHKDILDGKALSRLEFKEKEPWGWHAGVNAYFADGSKYEKPLETDVYFIAYLKSIAKNTACGDCPFNKLPRQGDLTIGDFWGIAGYDEEAYDKKGTSVVLVNNEKAKTFVNLLKPRIKKWKQEPLEVAIKGNRIIQGPYRLHKNRNQFFKKFDELNFESLTKGCFYNTLYKYEKNELKQRVPEEQHELYYLAGTAAQNCMGRKIITWIQSSQFEHILKEHFGLKVEFSVAKDEKKVNNSSIFPLSTLRGKSGEYFVVGIDAAYRQELYEILNTYGYKEERDFIFKNPKPIVLEKFDLSKERYVDLHGNTIEGYSGVLGKVVFHGGNNHIIIGSKVSGTENLTFDLAANSYIEIGNGNHFNGLNRFVVLGHRGKSEIIIESGCRFTEVLYRIYNNPELSAVYIGDSCTFEKDLELHANSGKKIIIGRDCMFSHGIDLWAGDGHSIFDVETGQNINSVYDESRPYRNEIRIGDHVWVSKGAFILHGTQVGNGSIIGAMSVVKGMFPNNCTVAGNPARIVRKNSAWSREMVTGDIRKCGKPEYYALTCPDANSTEVVDKSVGNAGKRKVLILGGTGRMSYVLTNLCLENGDDVTIASRGRHKKDRLNGDVKHIIFDRLNEQQTKSRLKGKRFDVVFDCSGYVPQSVDWVLTTLHIGRYIYLSSFETYAHYHSGIAVKEEDLSVKEKAFEQKILPGEKAWYSRGKYNSEILIANKYPCLNYAIVRIPFVMSLEDEDYEDSLSSRVMSYVKKVLNKEEINDKNLDLRYSFAENHEEAEFLYYLAACDYVGIVNFAAQGDISMREIIRYVEEKSGRKALYSSEAEALPFTKHPEVTMDLSCCLNIGYTPLHLKDWIYKKIDKYIDYLGQETKEPEKWLVTGIDVGIGYALVRTLRSLGYKVAVSGHDMTSMRELPEDIIKIKAGIGNMESCKAVVGQAVEQLGGIDVLVNSTGLFYMSSFEETPVEIGQNIIETNFWNAACMVKAVLPYMRRQKKGMIINISSASGFRAKNYGSYAVSSYFAIENLTRNINFEGQRFLRAVLIELDDPCTELGGEQAVSHTIYDEYKELPQLYPYKKIYRNRNDKIIQAIIDVSKEKTLPRNLILGGDAYQQYPMVLDAFERETEAYKNIAITTDEAKRDEIKIEDIILPGNPNVKIRNWLITGASEGFGNVLALRLRNLGYTVAVTSRSISKLNKMPNDIYKIESQLDSFNACEEVIRKATEMMGSVDVLVNNATSNCWSSFEEIPEDIMRDVFYVNYTMPSYLIRAVLPQMRKSMNGTIINITSIAGIQPRARVSTYSAAKAALEGLTKVLKSECQRFARLMAVELVCMRTRIMHHNPVIDSQYEEYQNLGRYTHKINNIPNRKDIAAQQLINVVNQEKIPASLLIGTESYMIAKDEIERARADFEKNRAITLSVCEETE